MCGTCLNDSCCANRAVAAAWSKVCECCKQTPEFVWGKIYSFHDASSTTCKEVKEKTHDLQTKDAIKEAVCKYLVKSTPCVSELCAGMEQACPLLEAALEEYKIAIEDSVYILCCQRMCQL
jgi:hypothetical protein